MVQLRDIRAEHPGHRDEPVRSPPIDPEETCINEYSRPCGNPRQDRHTLRSGRAHHQPVLAVEDAVEPALAAPLTDPVSGDLDSLDVGTRGAIMIHRVDARIRPPRGADNQVHAQLSVALAVY